MYAPFGDAPLLLHDVVLRNLAGQARTVTWYEYWDVNPVDQQTHLQLGLASPRYHAASRTLTVAEDASAADRYPLTVFAAAIRAPVAGFDTLTSTFFGRGGRRRPAAVTANRAFDSIAPPVPTGETPGRTLLVLRSPVRIPAHGTVTLRYAYGIAPARTIPALVRRYRAQASPLAASSEQWRGYLPRFSLPGRYRWLGRELGTDRVTTAAAPEPKTGP